MNATTLNCPSCGAAVSSEDPQCGHCGARLATIACPACFKMMFRDAKYCPACGNPGAQWESSASELPCPACQVPMLAGSLRDFRLHECPKCFGLWLDTLTFDRICQQAEQHVSVLGQGQRVVNPALQPVRYLPCPDCRQLMHRMNFAKCSGVIVDVCRPHGVWFDMNELHRILEFIQGGGLDRARQRERLELAEERRRLQDVRNATGAAPAMLPADGAPDLLTEIVSAAGDLFVDWL
jgi:Zn-finger nucleic acid-binding protein